MGIRSSAKERLAAKSDEMDMPMFPDLADINSHTER